MSRLRLAFLGVDHPHGAHWRQLLTNFESEFEYVALVPGFDGATASLEERLATLPRFETVDELLARGDFDIAVVCLANDVAPEAVLKLVRGGKHVLAEKTVGRCAQEFEPLAAAVQENGVAFQTGYMWRYDEGANRLRNMVRDGRFGKLISVEMTYVTSDIARRGPEHFLFDRAASGGGFFNWLGCHYLDLLLYLIEQPVVGVTARVGVFGSVPAEVEDGGVAILDLAGGGLATLLGGYWLPRWAGETRWCLRGDQRWVQWEPTRPGTSGVMQIHGPQPQWHPMEETFSLPEDKTPGYGGRRGVALVRDWLDAARAASPRPPCKNTPASTLATLQLIDTIYQSSREGRRIECRIPAN